MGFYARRVLPWFINLAMQNRTTRRERQRALPRAVGRVLEVGIGSGLNLPFYGPAVSVLVGIDPSAKLLEMARRRARDVAFPVRLVTGSAEALPLGDRTVDTVVLTWTLCSIPDAGRALGEVQRVLRAEGRVVFVEHGRSPDARVRRWQDRLTPLWRRVAGGCHLNRPIDTLLREAGFRLDPLEPGYATGPKVMTYFFRGVAHPPAAR